MAGVPDALFNRSTTTAREEIAEAASALEKSLGEINPNHSLTKCWEDTKSEDPYRAIINLYSMEKIGNGFARLFG